jgi:ATPase subunit of ABC transporter with duplicated ATPase domains
VSPLTCSSYFSSCISIDALSRALSGWGRKDGAMVVVSHDRAFCEEVGFTHVGTVKDGKLVVEQRGLRDSDWATYDMNGSAVGAACEDKEENAASVIEMTQEEKDEMRRKEKLAFNAPKRIKKLEGMIGKCEEKIAGIDDVMLSVGNDVGKLTDLSKQKQNEEEKVAQYTQEWEELEELLIELA